MRLRRNLFSFCTVLIGLVIDTSVVPFTGLPTQYAPKFALLTVLTIALLLGRTQGILFAAFGGLLLDVTVSVPTGVNTAVYIACALICGWFSHKRRRHFLFSVLVPLLVLSLYELFFCAYYFLSAYSLSSVQLLSMLIRTGIGVVIIQPMYLIFNKVLKPHRSRYAR